jgi:hypothetical protein
MMDHQRCLEAGAQVYVFASATMDMEGGWRLSFQGAVSK